MLLRLPARHRLHRERSSFGIVPFSHEWHSVEPTGTTMPAEQFEVHSDAPRGATLPASHSTQLNKFCSCVPAGHGSHLLLPCPRATVPGSHAVHWVLALGLNSPAGHTSQYERSSLGTRPSPHRSHFLEPGGATLSAGHDALHAVAPSALTFPASHSVHVALSSEACVPASHMWQADWPGVATQPGRQAVHDAALASERVPLGQSRHLSCCALGAKPASQVVHAPERSPSADTPLAAHGTHAVALGSAYVPATHATHRL